MTNTQLFQSLKGKLLPVTNTANEAGGVAYALTPKHDLAQLAVTGRRRWRGTMPSRPRLIWW